MLVVKMAAPVLMTMVTLMTLLHTGWALDCYLCMGYNSSLPQNMIYNNPNCPDGDFLAKNVSKVTTEKLDIYPSCILMTVSEGDNSITIRDASSMSQFQKSLRKGTISGYFCHTNLCNSSSVPTLLLPLLAVLVVLTCFLV